MDGSHAMMSRPRWAGGLLIMLLTLAAVMFVPSTQAVTTGEAAPAEEPTTAAISPSFVPNKLGAHAKFTLKFHFGGGIFGVPEPVSRSVLHLPVGLQLSAHHIKTCSKAALLKHGAKGCSPLSLIGRGNALAEIKLSAIYETEQATVWAFIGPFHNGNPTIEILAQGYTPLEKKVVLVGEVLPDQPPYGNKLVVSVPPIVTIPYEPNASDINFSLTVGSPPNSKSRATANVLIPKHCPAGGFPFLAEFAFEDGSSAVAHSHSRCP